MTNGEMTLVLGGTGKTGRRVAQRLTERGVPIRIGSRSGEPPFDWNDPSTWGPALRDVRSAYVTYYPDLAVPGASESIGELAALAVKSGVRRLVLLSGRGEEGALLGEMAVQESGAEWTILRSTWFSQNFSEGFFLDQVRSGEVALPAGSVKEPFVDAEDIADVAVAALTEHRHGGEVYELTGPRLLTFAEAIEEIAEAAALPERAVRHQEQLVGWPGFDGLSEPGARPHAREPVVLHARLRDERHADASPRERDLERQAVGPHDGVDAPCVRRQPASWREAREPLAEAHPRGVVPRAKRPERPRHLRRSDEHPAHVPEPGHDRIAAHRPHRSERDVSLAPRQIEHGLARMDLDLHGGVALAQLEHQGRDHHLGEVRRACDPNQPGDRALETLRLAREARDGSLDLLGDGHEPLRRLGGRDALAPAAEERGRERLFHAGEASRYRRGVHAHHRGRATQGAGAAQGEEEPHVVPRQPRGRLPSSLHERSDNLHSAESHGTHA